MKKMKRLAVSLVMALTMLLSTVFSASAAAPAIEEIEHKGKGRIEVEFYGKVKYKRVKVTVKDNKGKKYKVKSIRKDDDDIKFTIKNYKKGRTYKVTIKGVKVKGTKKYGKRTAKITIPKGGAAATITAAKAIDIAKKHAASTWKANNFRDVDAEAERYANQNVWEVSFDANIGGVKHEFEYKIARNGGKILGYDRPERDD